jgi:hypothetical protein
MRTSGNEATLSAHAAVLLLSCPEQKGIVATVSDFIYRNDGNIVDADQHTDFEGNLFLQRIEWELERRGEGRAGPGGSVAPAASAPGPRQPDGGVRLGLLEGNACLP